MSRKGSPIADNLNTRPVNGEVQIVVNGEPKGDPIYLVAGDSLLFTMPGKIVNGQLAIAEGYVDELMAKLTSSFPSTFGATSRVANLEQTIRDMAASESLDEARGVAWRSGALTDCGREA